MLTLGVIPAAAQSGGTGAGIAPQLPTGQCNQVVLYTPATASAAGTLTIGTTTYSIASGTYPSGQAALVPGQLVCFIPGAANAAGQIQGGSVMGTGMSSFTVCGTVTAFTAAVSLTIGGIQFQLANVAPFTGGTPTVGQNEQIALSVNPLGVVTGGVVAATASCPAGTTTLQGPCGHFQAPTATAAGFCTFGAATFFVAPGTTLSFTNAVPLAARVPVGHFHLGAISFHRAE
jgi:hypothetical protein